MHSHTKRLTTVSAVVSVLLVSVVLSSWLIACSSSIGGQSNTDTQSIPSSGPDLVTFAPSIYFTQALRLITDLGLQPSLECAPFEGHYTPGSSLPPEPVWQPVGQKETFLHTHQILVSTTFSASPDWRLRLAAIPGVHDSVAQEKGCPQVIYGAPPPGVIMPLSSAQAGIYVRISFTIPLQTYDMALYTVSNLGLGLANICYEQAQLSAGKNEPPWRFTGQEQNFTQTHMLFVKTGARVTSSMWQAQLQAQSGVVSIEIPYTPICR